MNDAEHRLCDEILLAYIDEGLDSDQFQSLVATATTEFDPHLVIENLVVMLAILYYVVEDQLDRETLLPIIQSSVAAPEQEDIPWPAD